ncbi:hypothetical protein V3C99_018394 [Haemonchus contortus]
MFSWPPQQQHQQQQQQQPQAVLIGGRANGARSRAPSRTSPGRDWSSSGGAVATDTSNGAGGMGPARKAGKTAPPTTEARSRSVVGVGRDPEGPPQKGGRRARKEPFGIWGRPSRRRSSRSRSGPARRSRSRSVRRRSPNEP